ncbi:MAG TPA: response regulator transcription factor, partial [Ktedonobacterales bacterium]|nr:response regulator transcription factor [Ktedonobacterales bacterium]
VDSDRDMVEMVTGWLRTRGYEVHHAFTSERAKQVWLDKRPDVVIIDPENHGNDPLAMCREMRDAHDALVLVFTTTNGDDVESAYLESGADSFLAKPFLPRQLIAHLKALSRRVRSTLVRNPSTIIDVGPLRVDTVRHEVTRDNKTVRLTPTESRLLHLLAANANDICTLDQIVTHVWGFGESGDSYLVKAHIRHLREKIEPIPSKPRFILTSPGVGYMLKRHTTESIPVSEEKRGEEPPAAPSDIAPTYSPAPRIAPGVTP